MDSTLLRLPSSWVVVKLGYLVRSEKGKKPKSESKAKNASCFLPYVDIQAFEEGFVHSWTDGIGCRLCYESDLLMVWDGARAGLIGKGIKGALGSTLVRINFPLLVNDYAFYFLQSKYQQINTRAKGSGTPHVDPDLLWNYDLPIPPENEQHRIVAKIEELFSELDKGIESLKTARSRLKVYRQALLKHAFEGKLTAKWREENKDKLEAAEALLKRIQTERDQRHQLRLAEWEADGKQGNKPKAPKIIPPLTAEELTELPELPEGWGWGSLIGACEAVVDCHNKTAPYQASGIPLVRTPSIRDMKLNFDDSIRYVSEKTYKFWSKRCQPQPGDILFTREAPMGESAIIPEGKLVCMGQRIMLLRPSRIFLSAKYLLCATQSPFFKKAADMVSVGTGVKHLRVGDVERLVFPICSTIEQLEVANQLDARLSVVDQLDQTITTSLQQAEALRQSILKKAFSGQLVAQDANDEPASILLERIKAEKFAQSVKAKPRKPQKAQVQTTQIKINAIPFPVKIPNISATDLHAGVLARAYHLHEQNPKYLAYFGHVKAEKIAHLVEAHLGIDLERKPIKDAAGPNDYRHLKKVESRARKANWFDVRQQEKGGAYVFHKKHGFKALMDKTTNALGGRASEVDDLLTLLLPLKTDHAAVVATIYAAWNNLLLLGHSPGDEEIVCEAREDWHPSKLKIAREDFFDSLKWMRKHLLFPVGRGRYVLKKRKRETAGRSTKEKSVKAKDVEMTKLNH